MKTFLKRIITGAFLATMLLVPVQQVAAVDVIPNDICRKASSVGDKPTACQEDTPRDDRLFGPGGIFELAVNIIAIVAGVAAVIVIIIAGMQYMLSTGDPTKTNNAKNALIYAIVGLIVVVLARFLVVMIIGRLR